MILVRFESRQYELASNAKRATNKVFPEKPRASWFVLVLQLYGKPSPMYAPIEENISKK